MYGARHSPPCTDSDENSLRALSTPNLRLFVGFFGPLPFMTSWTSTALITAFVVSCLKISNPKAGMPP